jgi:hypothetical protein
MSRTSYNFGKRSNNPFTSKNTEVETNNLVITNESQFANILNLPVSAITNFIKTGNNFVAKVKDDYSLRGAFLDTFGESNLKIYRDLEGKCKVLGEIGVTDFSIHFTNLEELTFPEAHTLIGHSSLYYCFVLNSSPFKKLYIPKVTTITGGADFFQPLLNNPRIYVNPVLETSNSGNWSNTLINWKNKGAKIMFVRGNSPFPVFNNSNIIEYTPYSIRLLATGGVNDVDEYYVYDSNDNLISQSEENWLFNLNPNTPYSFKVQVRDSADLYNSKGLISFTTPTNEGLFSSLTGVFDCTGTNPLRITNKYKNAPGWSKSTSKTLMNQPGKINKSIFIDRDAAFVFPVENTKAFTFWMKQTEFDQTFNNSYLFDARNGYSAYMFPSGSAGVSLFKVNNVTTTRNGNIPLNEWVFIYIELNGIYASGNLTLLGNNSGAGTAGISAYMEQLLTWNRGLTSSEIDQLINNGNGINI